VVQQMLIGVLLDAGGRDVARWIAGFVAVVLCVLLLSLVMPIIILAAVFGGGGPTGGASPSPAPPSQIAPPGLPAPPGSPALPGGGSGGTALSSAVDIARRYLGVPYVFGGSNPAVGLDCSGLVQLVYRQLGIALPRTAQTQFDASMRVERDRLQPGDLVFFARTYIDPHDWITHVGIYIGGGMQINAPTEGQVVSIQPVFSGFWGAHFASGGRIHGA
jgi:cell wall-associated NlpC family hydrolase